MYILKTSDSQHKQLGTSRGNRQNEVDGSFWITGWTGVTQNDVAVGGSYFLSDNQGQNFSSVEVVEIGGIAMGGIRFSFNS